MIRKHVEPDIYINGYQCTISQAMTIRVAIEQLFSYLDENGLGDDKEGIEMTNTYIQRIHEIREMIFKEPLPKLRG